MACTALVLAFLAVASFTDIRWHLIHNKTTYSGVVIALACSALATLMGVDVPSDVDPATDRYGFLHLYQSLLGLVLCGTMVVVCYVFLPGQLGGGDVKLLAMVGAFLGIYQGLESLLWTFVLAGSMALIVLVWRVGFWRLFRQTAKSLLSAIRFGHHELTAADKEALKTQLFLSPSAFLAVAIVRFHLVEWLRFR